MSACQHPFKNAKFKSQIAALKTGTTDSSCGVVLIYLKYIDNVYDCSCFTAALYLLAT